MNNAGISGRRLSLLGVLLLYVFVAACGRVPAESPKAPESATVAPVQTASTEGVSETKVVKFSPAAPGGEECEGYCWTASLADRRSDAFRCMVGNRIFDPCFVVEGKVICGANPVTKEAGCILKLTKPLPDVKTPASVPDNWAWIVELGDGTICSFMTGATAGVEGKRLNYGCSGKTDTDTVWILGDLQPGKIWYAEKVVLTKGSDGPIVKKSETVPVRIVWQ
ncbi:MAG: hypothetical protein ABIH46_13280 [Chloroflexota bacterium]